MKLIISLAAACLLLPAAAQADDGIRTFLAGRAAHDEGVARSIWNWAEVGYQEVRLEGQRPRVYGDAAVVTGRFISLRDGQPIAESRYTNTYVKQDGRWMVVASQITGVRRPER